MTHRDMTGTKVTDKPTATRTWQRAWCRVPDTKTPSAYRQRHRDTHFGRRSTAPPSPDFCSGACFHRGLMYQLAAVCVRLSGIPERHFQARQCGNHTHHLRRGPGPCPLGGVWTPTPEGMVGTLTTTTSHLVVPVHYLHHPPLFLVPSSPLKAFESTGACAEPEPDGAHASLP